MRPPCVDHREGAVGRRVVFLVFNLEVVGLEKLIGRHHTITRVVQLNTTLLAWVARVVRLKYSLARAEQVMRERLEREHLIRTLYVPHQVLRLPQLIAPHYCRENLSPHLW